MSARGHICLWRQRENDALKIQPTLAVELTLIALVLASLWWIATKPPRAETLNPNRAWSVD
jgi:hypothetical protein